jgi:hypothetical protein
MNCPFKSTGVEVRVSHRSAKKLQLLLVCPHADFSSPLECLKCPFFPDELRQHLLSIEMKVVKTHHPYAPLSHNPAPPTQASDGERTPARA